MMDTVEKLVQCGFRHSVDLQDCTVRELANEAKLSQKEASCVLEWMENGGQCEKRHGSSVLELLTTTQSSCITTQIHELDDILGGGLAIGEVTEICGVPGIGKSQFAIQAALSVQLPIPEGGLQSECVFIDTEGSFMIQRVASMAQSLENTTPGGSFKRDQLLQGIYYFRVHDYQELYQVIRELDVFLKEHPAVKLIVVDSIAFHFRHEFEDMAVRSRALASLSLQLHQLSTTFQSAVLLVNQVTTKVQPQTGAQDPVVIPALGDSWSHCVTNRIVLSWKKDDRMAQLIKSPYRKLRSAFYVVNEQGIRSRNDLKRKGEP